MNLFIDTQLDKYSNSSILLSLIFVSFDTSKIKRRQSHRQSEREKKLSRRGTPVSWRPLDNDGRNKNRWLLSIPEWSTISNEPYGRQ